MVPGGVAALVESGHRVLVERGAGLGSAIDDDTYRRAGAAMVDNPARVWAEAELIVKVRKPVPVEYDRLRPGQIVLAYFHLAADPDLAEVLLARKVTAVAYETIEAQDGRLPLLQPMSEVAGRMAIQVGARCLERELGGAGILLGGVPGVSRGNVVIIGAGVVGTEAAKMAIGMGAIVTALDISMSRLTYLDDIFGGRIQTIFSNPATVAQAVKGADLVVGAVLIAGARAPQVVTRDTVESMRPGSVIVDVAIDQGGCVETSRPTTHHNPIYVVHDVVHYCVSNMAGAVPRTSTFALTNRSLKHAHAIANRGLEAAVRDDARLRRGVNAHDGYSTHQAVSESLDLPYHALTF
jgi:alanine dehydrogenase